MHLSTMQYFEDAPTTVSPQMVAAEDMAWREVSKGLLTVLSGYLLTLLNAAAGFALLWFASHGLRRSTEDVTGDDLTIYLIGGAILFFSSLYSGYLVLRGKWRCMMNAPEHQNARWLMFASMICVCAGPALSFTSGFVHGSGVQIERGKDLEVRPSVEKSAVRYSQRMREAGAAGYFRLAGSIITPFGPIFFVLFLRAVHYCLGSIMGARFAELYLLFVVLLFVGSMSLLLDPQVKIRFDLLAYIGIGLLVAGAWYFLLILLAVHRISRYLSTPRPKVLT